MSRWILVALLGLQAHFAASYLVPLTMRFNDDGRVKVDIAIARGKKTYDKRHSIAARDVQRDVERESRRRR